MAYDNPTGRSRDGGAVDGTGFGSYNADRLAAGDFRQSGYRASARHRGGDQATGGYEKAPGGYDPAPAGYSVPAGYSAAGGVGYPEQAAREAVPDDPHAAYRRDTGVSEVAMDSGSSVPAAALTNVFDDPAHGEPGRDRMAVHVWWEVALLVGAAGLAYLLHRGDPATLRGPALDAMLLSAAVLGLLVLGAGLTLRAGAPNLALGPVAVATALHYAENSDQGTAYAAGNAAIAGAVGGLLLAVVVVGLHVPAWAASLGGALAVIGYIQLRPGPVAVQGGVDAVPYSLVLFGAFAAVALIGGMTGTVRSVRRGLGRFRPVADPADRRGPLAAAVTGATLVVSVLLAVAAGVLLAAGSAGPLRPSNGLEWTGLAVGTAMLGGTSAFGRRGGVFGTLFAVVVVTLFQQYEQQQEWHISLFVVAAGVVVAGLVVTRLIEAYGRPLYVPGDEWTGEPEPTTPAPRWTAEEGGTASWSTALPAQPVQDPTDRWRDGRWGPATR